MSRLLSLMAGVVIALTPLTGEASSSPSPALDTLLLAAPSPDFVESKDHPGDDQGPLDAAQYAATFVGRTADTEKELADAGFIAGYGRTWVSLPAEQVLIEEVIAFTGGRGAKQWLAITEPGANHDPDYQHPSTVAGIDPANGGHFHYSSGTLRYGDDFGFVKGNDFFYVHIASAKDDAAALAATQTKAQFDFAPLYTISPSEWPEAASKSSASVGRIIWLVVIVVTVVISLIARSRRPTPVGGPTTAMAATLQTSPDGNYWWDGREWKDINQWVPPSAQRSADGTWWWDGTRWRPVPPLPKFF
jgi:hypothetical protein